LTLKPLILIMCMLYVLPLAYGVTIDGPVNFVQDGGNVRFGSAFTVDQYDRYNSLSTFTDLNWGSGTFTLGFDCETGVNMTIISIATYELRYRVNTAASGAVNTYVYYDGYGTPVSSTNTDSVNYNPLTRTTTVETTGNDVIVTLKYGGVGSEVMTLITGGFLVQAIWLITATAIGPEIAAGLIALGVMIPTYVMTDRIEYSAALWVLLGGVLEVQLPGQVLGLGKVLFILGMAVFLWRMVVGGGGGRRV